MKHSSIWSCLMIFSVVGISLLTSCGRSGKVEITPYILNLHLKYTHIDNFEHGIARVSMDTKTESGRETAVYGCIDERGKEVIPCIYELVFVEPGGIVALSKEGGYKLFVYRDGGVEEFSLPSGIQPISGFCCDRSAVCDEYYNYGYIDSEGNLVVPCRYERVNDYNEGLAVVEQNWRKGYVDTDGYEVSPVSYREAEMFRNGRGCVQNEAGLYGYVDETGREGIPCRFEKAISFYGEVTPACLNGLYGLIDKDGEFISTPRYEAMGICDVDVFYFYENGLYGFVDAEQKELTSARYDRIGELFSEGLIDVEQQGKHGFINKQGEEVIPCIYSRVSRFENGFARVARNGRVGYIDTTGREVFLLPSNSYASTYRSGYGVFCFKSGGEIFIFDEEGNRLDSNGRETPGAISAGSETPASGSVGSDVVSVPAVSAPVSSGSNRSDPARRVEWEIRRSRAIEELTRLQMKLIEDPNSAAIKHNIQSQQNIINTCNEMIAIYQ